MFCLVKNLEVPSGRYACLSWCFAIAFVFVTHASRDVTDAGFLWLIFVSVWGLGRYGVPGKHARGFEACLARVLGETLDTVSEHLYRITKMLSPVYLQRDKVSAQSLG